MAKKILHEESGKYVQSLVDNHFVHITCTVKQLKALALEAEKFSKSKFMKNDPGPFFRHLSPNVTFMFVKGKK